jgi:hypothetical protein
MSTSKLFMNKKKRKEIKKSNKNPFLDISIRFLLSEEELKILREGLKRKWEMVNKEYQSITHISKLDTIGLRRKYIILNK